MSVFGEIEAILLDTLQDMRNACDGDVRDNSLVHGAIRWEHELGVNRDYTHEVKAYLESWSNEECEKGHVSKWRVWYDPTTATQHIHARRSVTRAPQNPQSVQGYVWA
jgi:L-ribulose-5-phosphate 3-epimerase UlaE